MDKEKLRLISGFAMIGGLSSVVFGAFLASNVFGFFALGFSLIYLAFYCSINSK